MKLTKKKALQICRDLWAWLAKNPVNRKIDWPGWAAVGPMLSNCPCCEYAGAKSAFDSNCEKCPLRNFWPKGNCTSFDSPFWEWVSGNDRRGNARAIADACRKELKKL